jgi:hypothetical protein
MSAAAQAELSLFGDPELRLANGETVHLRRQLKQALAILAIEGGSQHKVADARLIEYLWFADYGKAGALNTLVGNLRSLFRGLGADHEFVVRAGGMIQLVGISIDVQQFELAFRAEDWQSALDIASRGALIDTVPSAARGDWVDRVRGRFGGYVDRCFRGIQEALAIEVTDGDPAALDALIALLDRREQSAIAYDLPESRILDIREYREKLELAQKAERDTQAPKPASRSAAIRRAAERLIVERMGSGSSLIADPAHVDSSHRYTHIARTDLLDYATGDFFSLRRLVGINVGSGPSHYLVYAESSEAKIPFDSTGTQAFDWKSQRPLLVEPLLPPEKPLFQHGFRIYFKEPIASGEAFDVCYAIRLPGELNALSPKEEMMSVSLVRLANPVQRLDFGVCLNFEPLRATAERLTDGGKFEQLDGHPSVSPWTPKEWFERDFDIPWSDTPYLITFGIDNPTSAMYVIRYRA